ncbi:LysR family transcriptional regulator [Exilibacterium tricleocarpae]|uniref:LysR family transcriptional regulator n=1 Tax=Exilibacterium tricleocarpae TaxID=2591008 RepID=A0A545TNE2_9GAMM|nr:LysR family transcriptional regulator [Exilibacterium tricleocarpae]TQV78743.1 LysR family transcriptional regulator [Exilibacterium tricleocarpae]
MELKWLEDFICLADTGSFSKAAENRNVTQSAFSRRIKSLEEWLGTRLIDRKSHPVTLTAAGTRFVETAQQSVRMFYKVRDDFTTQNRGKRQSLTIGIADHLSIHFFPSWLHNIEQEIGSYYFDLLSSIRSGIGFFESLRFQEFDFLICYSSVTKSIPLQSDKFVSLTLGGESLIPVCETTLLQEQQYYLPGSLQRPLPYISYKQYSTLAKEVADITTISAVAPIYLDVAMETSSAESIKALVLEGYGIAWLPESAIRQELQSGTLQAVGDSRYHIPLSIDIYRYALNTKPEIMAFWHKLSAVYPSGDSAAPSRS